MKQDKVAEPYYEFERLEMIGEELLGKNIFTAEVSIMKCVQGEAKIIMNSRNHVFVAGDNFMLVDAMLFKVVECSDDFAVTVFRFSLLFMNEVYPNLDNKVLDVLQYCAPDIIGDKSTDATDLIIQQMEQLYWNSKHPYRHRIAINLVVNYILEVYDLMYERIDSSVINTSNYVNYILDLFCLLCSECHTRHRNIEYYAQRLNISSRYLHKITKDAFKATPKQLIDYYVSGSAKKLLLTTILTNQQIADKLNFPDQATFGQFFKRNVGMPPSEFRSKYR